MMISLPSLHSAESLKKKKKKKLFQEVFKCESLDCSGSLEAASVNNSIQKTHTKPAQRILYILTYILRFTLSSSLAQHVDHTYHIHARDVYTHGVYTPRSS